MCEPLPFSMNSGVPPTDLKALTGLLTPPGKYFLAVLSGFYIVLINVFALIRPLRK